MSIRPVSPPPVVRWPFVLGDVLCFAVAALVLFVGDSPPGVIQLLVFTVSILAGIGLLITPFIKEHEARTRVAEAHARESIDSHLRRLTQIAEQLTNAVSRSQSTEEQVGQALGTVEELTEKLTNQADELAQNLARSHEREIASLKADLERTSHERDQRLDALRSAVEEGTERFDQHEQHWTRASQANSATLEELKERVLALAARFDELTSAAQTERAAAGTPSDAPTHETSDASTSAVARVAMAPNPSTPPAPVSAVQNSTATAAPSPATDETRPAGDSTAPAGPVARESAAPKIESATAAVATTAPAARPRVRRAPADPALETAPQAAHTLSLAQKNNRLHAKPQPLELPLLDLNEAQAIAAPAPRQTQRPSSPAHHGSTSTLVATAYIGIGNKLFVRGDGPGLSWEQGVPMQFLAIGKWGWTSPDTAEPITCRIYRNDETPMLDENIIIEPGAKAEVTPRF